VIVLCFHGNNLLSVFNSIKRHQRSLSWKKWANTDESLYPINETIFSANIE